MIFSKRIKYITQYTKEGFLELLQKDLDKPSILTKLFSGNRNTFQGKVTGDNFRITMNHWNTNSVTPIIKGKVIIEEGKTILNIKFEMHIVVQVITYLLSFGLILYSLPFFGSGFIYEVSIIGLAIPILMLGGFDLMSNVASDFLEKKFRLRKTK